LNSKVIDTNLILKGFNIIAQGETLCYDSSKIQFGAIFLKNREKLLTRTNLFFESDQKMMHS